MQGTQSITRIGHAATAGLLICALWVPLVGTLVQTESGGADFEKRKLAEMPRLPGSLDEVRSFPREFEVWHDDHFGYRRALISAGSMAKLHWLGVSPRDDVLIGTEGWLYKDHTKRLGLYAEADPMEDEEMRVLQRHFEELHEWFDDRGIPFHLVVVPAKSTIYPEFLPTRLRRVGQVSRLDQLVEHLGQNSDVRLIDLRAALLEAKQHERVYHRADVHWNLLGGFAGYLEIQRVLRDLFPAIGEMRREEWTCSWRTEPGGDLAGLLGMTKYFEEETPFLEPLSPGGVARVTEGLVPKWRSSKPSKRERKVIPMERRVIGFAQDAPQLPSLIMVRDSFTTNLLDFLPRDFRRSVFYWQYRIDPRAVLFEAPDLVIQELGEMNLVANRGAGGGNLPEIRRDFAARRAFRASAREVFQERGGTQSSGLSLRRGVDLSVGAPTDADTFILRYAIEADADAVLELSTEDASGRGDSDSRELLRGLNIGYMHVSGPGPVRFELQLATASEGPVALTAEVQSLEVRLCSAPSE